MTTNRQKAIYILERLSNELSNEHLFDSHWYKFEDIITEILDKECDCNNSTICAKCAKIPII